MKLRKSGIGGTEGLARPRGLMTYDQRSKKWRKWVLEEAESQPFIRPALEAEIAIFDTANMYSLGATPNQG